MADNFVPIKRPKPGDDEEELLRMQQEFNEKKLEPCAKVINLREKDGSPVKKQSKFAQSRSFEAQKKRISTSQTQGNMTNENTECSMTSKEEKKVDPINNYFELSSNIIMGNIVERKPNIKEFKPECKTKDEESLKSGFPSSFVSSDMFLNANTNGSLFMNAIAKQQSQELKNSMNDNKGNVLVSSKSHVVTGPLAQEIHKENLEKLKEMSKEEILLQKKNLESMLDPNTIAFIKSMKDSKNKSKDKLLGTVNKQSSSSSNQMEIDENLSFNDQTKSIKMSVDEENAFENLQKNYSHSISCEMEINVENNDKALPEPVIDIVKKAELKGWVHMDDPEPEKVKWMEDLLEKKENSQLIEEPYNARFDFNGTLLPFNDENLTVDKGLHHHGEEPERPGYSLQELLQLSRSAAQQQRCTALGTLANILEKTYLGWYDRVLQPPLLDTLNQKNILLLLRFSLDDTALPVITSALQALKAFLFSETDEICLDRIFGVEDFDEPVLKPEINDVDNVESLKDHELAQFDTVAAAMRSDIVLRIRFLLSEMRIPSSGITAALEILTRLARHSRETALNIACTPNLLDVIVKTCIPISMNQPAQDRDSSKAYGCPLVAAVRLCRILIIYAGRPVLERLKNLKIMSSLLTYISSDASRQEVHLHIESLRLWRLFLHFGIETDSIIGARLTLISQLRLLASTLDLDVASPLTCDYAAALIAVTKFDLPLKEHVTVLLTKWSTQLSKISTPNWHHSVLISETLKALEDVTALQISWIQNTNVFSQLSSSSNLLSGLAPATNRNPSCLPSLGVMTYEGKLQPLMSQHSQVIFLKTVLEYFFKYSRICEIQQMFRNVNFQNYLQRLKRTEWSLERSFFTRLEYSFLMTVIKIENEIPEVNDTVWKIGIKLISALPADCPMNVKDVLTFTLAPERRNLRFLESGLAHLDLNRKHENIEEVNIPSLAIQLYEKFVSPNGKWSEAAMPKDWLYLPLIDSYTRMKNLKTWRYSDTEQIINLLQIELIMPELTQSLSVNLRFSRMILLYLCDDTFLHPPKSELPHKILDNFVRKNYKKLDLSAEVPGLNSFIDLFTALCENFLAHSYAADFFASALLIFVAQRFDVHYRKLLWSEHAGALQYCKLTSDKLIIPYEEYLYPLEKDSSLIEAYITALVRHTVKEKQSPVMYNIALHHSAMYLKESDKLARIMRLRIGRLLNDVKMRDVATRLLDYEPAEKTKLM